MSGGEDKDDRQHEPSEQKLRRARDQDEFDRFMAERNGAPGPATSV